MLAVTGLAAFQLVVLAAPIEVPRTDAGGGARPIAYDLDRVAGDRYRLTLHYDEAPPARSSIVLQPVADPASAAGPPRSSALLPGLDTTFAVRRVVVLKVPPGTYRLSVDGSSAFGVVVRS